MTNVDKNKLFPNQLLDGNGSECTGITAADIAGNIDGRIYSPDFTYASTFRLLGQVPTEAGTDPWAAMQSVVYYGLLPAAEADFTAKTIGELYAANWQNYSKQDTQSALSYVKNGVKNIGIDFNAVKEYIRTTGYGVSISGTWYQSFTEDTHADGILPAPTGNTTLHTFAAYGENENGALIIKPWLGASWGDKGYGYLDEAMFRQIVNKCIVFDPNASRWISILSILVTRFPILVTYLPALLKAGIDNKVSTPNPTPISPQPTIPPQNANLSVPEPSAPVVAASPYPIKIQAWANEIFIQEGGRSGDPNVVNKNPGNIKWTSYTSKFKGVVGHDNRNFLIFNSIEEGHNALCQFLSDACHGLLIPYQPSMSILAFTAKYAEPPNDNYAKAVASAMGLQVTDPISKALS